MLYILCFNIIKIVSKNRGLLDSYYLFLCKDFVLTCLKMTYVQVETCSIHVNVI